MKYTVYLFDKSYKVVDESKYPNGIADVEAAMFDKTPVDLNGSLVSGSAISKIEKFGNPDYASSELDRGTFEQAAMLMDSRRNAQSRREEIFGEIRETLKKAGADDQPKRDYAANLRLARMLHDDTASWRLDRWDQFIAAHPKPQEELAALIESREKGTK